MSVGLWDFHNGTSVRIFGCIVWIWKDKLRLGVWDKRVLKWSLWVCRMPFAHDFRINRHAQALVSFLNSISKISRDRLGSEDDSVRVCIVELVDESEPGKR